MRWTRIALLGLLVCLFGPAAQAEDYRTLAGHGGPIHDVTVSADGTRALTASFDNSVGLWDLATGQARWLDGHDAAVKTVIFLDEHLAASGGDDFAIEVWNLEQAARLFRLDGHKGQISGLAVSPDGQTLASASWDGTIGLWPLSETNPEGPPPRYLRGHEAAVNAVAFSGDGTLLYSGSADGTIRIWDVALGQQSGVLVRHGFGITTLLVNPRDGWLVYGAVDGGTRVLGLATGQTLADLTLDRRPVLDIAANPDFSQISVGDGEGHIMVVDTADWDILHDFRAARRGPVWALAYSADSGSVLAGGIDDELYVWPVGAKADGPIMGQAREFLRAPETMSNGERQFRRKCSICHAIVDDGVRRAGPPLVGLFGRRAGSYPGYAYSPAVAGSKIIWNDLTIDALFDQGPEHFIPGTKMPMQVIARADDRADLIAFLRDFTRH